MLANPQETTEYDFQLKELEIITPQEFEKGDETSSGSPNEDVEQKKEYVSNDLMNEGIYFCTLQELCESIDNPDKGADEGLDKGKGDDRTTREESNKHKEQDGRQGNREESFWRTRGIVRSTAGEVPEPGERSLTYDQIRNLYNDAQGDKLISGGSETIKKYRDLKVCSFCSHYTCLDERLSNNEIDTKLEQVQEMHESWELSFFYWHSYRNGREQYYAVRKYLLEELLGFKRNRDPISLGDYNQRWEECEEIIRNNFIRQHKYIANVYYTLIWRSQMRSDDFRKILQHLNNSWDEVTIDTRDRCISVIEGPPKKERGIIRDAGAVRILEAKENWSDYLYSPFFQDLFKEIIRGLPLGE
ncbi:hypothetical protein C922_05443 [Plasmodium inui San Antonio 1]|uniref:Plasmodium RESA N-terminal domain-containing protein n=1 Tax=Plasmodium inui San Antonio 1 TaxID=1237626 RepID=W7AFV1_9APIC|nr:hypothetical protein C922_05443 [Plasmodium inui San Antonio 1]EUD64176.1 hypothetical protein C922_05443 [Plasmodium inui San Antonio 1]